MAHTKGDLLSRSYKWLILSKQKHNDDYVRGIIYHDSCVYCFPFLTVYNLPQKICNINLHDQLLFEAEWRPQQQSSSKSWQRLEYVIRVFAAVLIRALKYAVVAVQLSQFELIVSWTIAAFHSKKHLLAAAATWECVFILYLCLTSFLVCSLPLMARFNCTMEKLLI